MSKMISVATDFQYSVNIAYDLNDNEKLKNFIPTQTALALLEEVILSTDPRSTDRARVLVGAYGKGKSHIVLAILAILMKKDLSLFEKALPKIRENSSLYRYIKEYYESDSKILPVVISGGYTSLSQAFLLSLHRTLSENNLLSVMPQTNYKAALQTIERWKVNYPDTYQKFIKSIRIPEKKFIKKLRNYDPNVYEEFVRIYPQLTAGSSFYPFAGFNVVELYEEAVKGLRSKGYSGIYVVYDEFSKFLETEITEASVSDTKMLQDFAEKCNRSGENQMHIMLISHKEISNYIDKLPKQKIDGWRGVSDRFKHIHLNNNFIQTYEIITAAIQKNERSWSDFCKNYRNNFEDLIQIYINHNIFSEVGKNKVAEIIYGCYPLHPVSTFILPRLSEKVAQNERTLFTFISAHGKSTLPAFLERYNDDHFEVIMPDVIYDYFESLMQKEIYNGDVYAVYILSQAILGNLEEGSLESRIIKTLSLIYMVGQFEKLRPTKNELINIYSVDYEIEKINQAINNLIETKFVIYLKKSNGFLQMKQTSGVDVQQKINDMVEIQQDRTTIKEILNNSNLDNYIYPSRYNDERNMIRYFSFQFIDENEVTENVEWEVKSKYVNADGIIFGVIPHSEESLEKTKKILLNSEKKFKRVIFVLPKHYSLIENTAKLFSAVGLLRDEASNDRILFDEYDVIYQDLREVIDTYIHIYTKPEEYKSIYIYCGEEVSIKRKAALTELMSQICDSVYSDTPVINNEALNRNEITSIANSSRKKIITALLRNELEPNLGFAGTGQEVSIMRSVLVRTGIWEENNGIPRINLHPQKTEHIDEILSVIEEFIIRSGKTGPSSFAELYDELISPEYHIGLRKGLIPIYLSAVIHEYKKGIIITDRQGQVPISVDVILQINAKPGNFSLEYLEWNPEKEEFVNRLAEIFKDYIAESEQIYSSYDYVGNAMERWYLSLPKITKESRNKPDGMGKIPEEYQKVLKLLKQNVCSNELLFIKLPQIFGKEDLNESLIKSLKSVKEFYDSYLTEVKKVLCTNVKEIFSLPENKSVLKKMSLFSVIKDWCGTLDETVFDQLFPDGTERYLNLFKNLTDDDELILSKLSKIATDLRIEDWGEDIQEKFYLNLKKFKKTAESYHKTNCKDIIEQNTSKYQIVYIDDNGSMVTKCFDSVEETRRGKLLYNQVTAALESMGQSISDQEKRQILMEILKELCE